jgi:hypothetical protein
MWVTIITPTIIRHQTIKIRLFGAVVVVVVVVVHKYDEHHHIL